MALHRKPKGGLIIRTPAPDEDARVQNYGGSSLVPGKGGPLTLLGANLRDTLDDPAMAKVLAQGTAGRGDDIPVTEDDPVSLNANDLPATGDLQVRKVSDTSYPLAHGATRQQNPDAVFGHVSDQPQRLARKLSANGMKALARGTARAAAARKR